MCKQKVHSPVYKGQRIVSKYVLQTLLQVLKYSRWLFKFVFYFLYRFKDLLTPELEGWRYAWNPCKSFTLGTCKNAAVSTQKLLHGC